MPALGHEGGVLCVFWNFNQVTTEVNLKECITPIYIYIFFRQDFLLREHIAVC